MKTPMFFINFMKAAGIQKHSPVDLKDRESC